MWLSILERNSCRLVFLGSIRCRILTVRLWFHFRFGIHFAKPNTRLFYAYRAVSVRLITATWRFTTQQPRMHQLLRNFGKAKGRLVAVDIKALLALQFAKMSK